jgi:hypothetical protein
LIGAILAGVGLASVKEADYQDIFLVQSAGANREGACWMTLEIRGRTYSVARAGNLLSAMSPCKLARSGTTVRGRFKKSFQHGQSIELLYLENGDYKKAIFEINSMNQ